MLPRLLENRCGEITSSTTVHLNLQSSEDWVISYFPSKMREKKSRSQRKDWNWLHCQREPVVREAVQSISKDVSWEGGKSISFANNHRYSANWKGVDVAAPTVLLRRPQDSS
jgi:hypothetical protein